MSLRLLPFKRALAGRQLPRALPQLHRSYASDSGIQPQKDAQVDREKMDTQANEYAKSGTDTETAQDIAFDPNSSNEPEQVMKEVGEQNDVNPLGASPANPELSSGTSEVSGGADKKASEGGGGRQGGGDDTGDKHGGSSV